MYMANGGIFSLSSSTKGKDVGRIVIYRGIALGLQYFVLSRICERLESWTIFVALNISLLEGVTKSSCSCSVGG